ncbi:aryldialkylphosphatase [Acrocarpospora pleiomorpha]|uniref:Aryldialkylphosphatase n=1 Tax=Acrocarpospora pleiomorpha TaxID=90975 RepID=A0A5M3X6Q2_9ACTN|nr:phosphotriesterase [Acrocarpospora pleiomorpha]GES17375.1 aryldialkylphosphatase [Acrocarpospora pleiomorpha]
MAALTSVNSVTGPIAPAELGVTLPHEHVFINMLRTAPRDGLLNVWEEQEAELRRYAEAGGTTILDVTNGELSELAAPLFWGEEQGLEISPHQDPVTGSRSPANVLATKAMAETVGLAVVLGTGHYHDSYLHRQWFESTPTNRLADFLIRDLVDEIPGTGVRAGFLGEIAADHAHVTTAEERSFRAAGRAARETGVMISTHAPTHPVGLAQLDILTEEGVPPERIVIGHADTVKHIRYSLELARRGVFVQYDCLMTCRIGGHLVMPELERRISYLLQLVDAGYEDQILLSQDVCARSHLHLKGGPGYAFLFTDFFPLAVDRGLDPGLIRRFTVDNPRRALFGG